jgi:hypothetical protein
MTPPRPLHYTLPLDRQHLAAFTERHYRGTLQAVRIRTLRGGLQAAGVFRVQAQLRSPTGRQRAASFVVKLAHGEARRELTMYRALEAHAGEALAPRLLGVAHASATDRTGRNTVIPRPCASWAKDECGCWRRAPRCRAAAAVWSLQTIVYILIDVVLFRYPPAVLRGLGVRDGVLAGPARGPTSLPGDMSRGACGCAVAILPLW